MGKGVSNSVIQPRNVGSANREVINEVKVMLRTRNIIGGDLKCLKLIMATTD